MKAIYFYRDVCVDLFIIIKRGECIWNGRRITGYKVQKGIKYGECYEIEYTEEKDASSKREKMGGNYFTIITKKHESSFEERKQNLFDAMQIIIDEFFTTFEERNGTYDIKKNLWFAETGLQQEIEMGFGAIEKMFRQEKLSKETQIAKRIKQEFEKSSAYTMCKKENEIDSKWDSIEYIKRVKKRDFGIFTSDPKVIDHIHKLIQQSARTCYNNLIDELQDKTLTHFKYKEKELVI